MLNGIWLAMVLLAVVCGALTGRLDGVTKASTDSAKAAVELAIGLVGVMALWLGLMRILQEGGLLAGMARVLKPVTTRLFPTVPADHPAMSMMILNFASNMLGLANAATPFGIKAMTELDKLNPRRGVATDAMALFLAINTSGLALLPTGVIALRASLGSTSPGSILVTTLLATMVSTSTAVLVAKLVVRSGWWRDEGGPLTTSEAASVDEAALASANAAFARQGEPVGPWQRRLGQVLVLGCLGVLAYAVWQRAEQPLGEGRVGMAGALNTLINDWMLVILLAAIVLFGFTRGVKIYDAVVEGGKEGFQVALRIIPYLVAILVAVGMLRASGAIDLAVTALAPVTALVGMPAETLPMALLRPLSGSGAYAVAAEAMKTYGPDSLIGNIVATMQGSTETTFYVLAVYFGAVGVRNTRYTLIPCLVADVAGLLTSVWVCRWLLT